MSTLFVALSLYAAVLVVAFGAGLVIERAARAFFRKKAEKTQTDWDDWLATEGFHLVPSLLLAVVATRVLMAIRPPSEVVAPLVTTGLQVVLVLAAIRVGVDVGLASLRMRQQRLGQQGVSILRNTLVGVALTVGILVVLDQLGISVAPLLATLGVGALALALALQPTLGNIFAGIQLVAAAQFKVGDFLRVNDAGVEGYVTDIGWRTTTLRTLLDNHVIIPNSQLADSVLTNLHTPDPRVRLSIGVGVHYDTDLEEADRIAREVIREVQDGTEAGVSGFAGHIRWREFGDSAITFDAILQAKKPLDRFDLASAFIKRLHRRYDEAGIEIPYPIRNLYLRTGLEVTGPGSGTTGPEDG
ncbi:MAG: mechanosensitive ion channel family protein [Acidobacteria bacterium]|nr:mechanosensitive ion channel family protein [Acidobacteriota bacterium]MXW38928.1 mechanosensitive ion channel family protein [Acidobacteriota bacterium]MXZ60145.1 mechanosensitive ion channel family protein [Acidobacteriota bacterium]MYA44879.1 mechanosensitive ion channel family protein [Acidobacteriota bacterium]MYB32697.1 mechanosensitive ion channel family protein [Acidobacteriota bacterium]